MSDIATLDQHINTVGKFLRVMREAGIPESLYQAAIDDPAMREDLVAYARWRMNPAPTQHWTEPPAHVGARRIMGDGFYGLPETESAFGAFQLEPQNALNLASIPYTEKTLRACAKTHVLVADIGLSLANMAARLRRNSLDVERRERKVWNMHIDHRKAGGESTDWTHPACWRLVRCMPAKNHEALEGSLSNSHDLLRLRSVINVMTVTHAAGHTAPWSDGAGDLCALRGASSQAYRTWTAIFSSQKNKYLDIILDGNDHEQIEAHPDAYRTPVFHRPNSL